MSDLTGNFDEFLLLKIFSAVPLKDRVKLESVCKRWRNILLTSYQQIRNLSISELIDEKVYKSANGHQKVESLLIKFGGYVSNLKFPSIDSQLTNLQSLKVLQSFAKFEITSEIINCISNHCPKLKSLDLSYHYFPSEVTFSLLANLPSTVELLKLENCRLDNLSLRDVTISDVTTILDQILKKIFLQLPKLQVFSLKGSCYNFLMLTERSIIHLPRTIRSLDLSNGYSLKISSLTGLDRFDQLSSLHLERTSITDADILIISRMAQMRHLNLSYSKLVTNFQPLSELHSLEYLHLNGNRNNLLDSHFIAICHGCANLKCLSIESCCSLTDAGLRPLSLLKELVSLSVNSCPLGDYSLCLIATSCPKIQLLQLKYCRLLTLQSFQHLTLLKHLTQLGLVGLSELDQTYILSRLKLQGIVAKLIWSLLTV